jgi:hypothetical protein
MAEGWVILSRILPVEENAFISKKFPQNLPFLPVSPYLCRPK